MRTNFRTLTTSIAASVFMAAAFANFPASVAFGQEAKTEKELPSELTTPARSTVDAVDAQTEAIKAAAAAQKKAAEENAAAVRELAAAQKTASDNAAAKPAEKKESTDYTWWVVGGLVALVFAFGIWFFFFRRPAATNNPPRPGGPRITGVIITLIGLGFAVSAVKAAPCYIPAGQPFAVNTLTVVRDPANPEAPTRRMIMPGQERRFRIGGCGFGWDVNQVDVGFSGTGMNVWKDEVTNDHIIIRVKPQADAELNYRNLAVAVMDVHGRKNLIRTPLTLEVAPPAAYWALQAQEQRPVGRVYAPATTTADSTARAAALAAAHNATSAIDTAKTAANAAVTLGTRFEQLFGKDGKSGSVGSEIMTLRKDVSDLQAFQKSADPELFYQDGSSRMDDITARVDALEKKGQSGNVAVDGATKADLDNLRGEIDSLRLQINAYGNVTVGAMHRGTIAEKAAGSRQTKLNANSKPAPLPPVRNPIQ